MILRTTADILRKKAKLFFISDTLEFEHLPFWPTGLGKRTRKSQRKMCTFLQSCFGIQVQLRQLGSFQIKCSHLVEEAGMNHTYSQKIPKATAVAALFQNKIHKQVTQRQ